MSIEGGGVGASARFESKQIVATRMRHRLISQAGKFGFARIDRTGAEEITPANRAPQLRKR
jgi:hypothetical protein